MDTTHLIQKAIKGEQAALKLLYDTFVDDMYSSAFRITNSRTLSQDAVQEAFITSFNKLESLINQSNYQGWLKRIVINNSLKAVKSKVNFKELGEYQIEAEDDRYWYDNISFDQIKVGIQELPIGARTVFVLYALEGYKHSEIATVHSISISTSKTQYRYAKSCLRQILTKMYSDEI